MLVNKYVGKEAVDPPYRVLSHHSFPTLLLPTVGHWLSSTDDIPHYRILFRTVECSLIRDSTAARGEHQLLIKRRCLRTGQQPIYESARLTAEEWSILIEFKLCSDPLDVSGCTSVVNH